jgi:hypothetical protein
LHVRYIDPAIQVVDDRAIVQDLFERAIAMPVVKLRGPVGTAILLDAARRTKRCLESVVCRGRVEVYVSLALPIGLFDQHSLFGPAMVWQ